MNKPNQISGSVKDDIGCDESMRIDRATTDFSLELVQKAAAQLSPGENVRAQIITR